MPSYEWQKIDAKTKQPFAIALKSGEPYGFAGLWERWHDKAADADLLTFSVITTDAKSVVESLHDRMPVILPERDYSRWLDVAPRSYLPSLYFCCYVRSPLLQMLNNKLWSQGLIAVPSRMHLSPSQTNRVQLSNYLPRRISERLRRSSWT
jgi:hypothetical protein